MKENDQFIYVSCEHHEDKIPSKCINKVEHNGRPVGYWYCYSCGRFGHIDSKEVKKMAKCKTSERMKRVINWNVLTMENEGCYTEKYKPFDVSLHTLYCYSWGWDGEAYTFPMNNEYGEIIGIHRRFPTGEKCCVEGSQLGLFLPSYLGHVMGIVEGVSDSCVAFECGLPTIGLPSASYGHEMAVAYLKINNISSVVLIGDRGEAGQKSVEKLKNLLDKEPGIVYNVVQAEKYKDLRKFYEVNGKKKTTKLLLGD